MCCIHYRYLDQQEAAWKSITPIKSSVTTDCYGMTWKLQVCDINSLQRAASLGFYFHILQLGSFTFFWQIGVIEGWLRTNTFLQAFISQSVHLPSENYDPPLTSISSRQWEEFFAKASCACYKIAGSCKNCDKLEFMFREETSPTLCSCSAVLQKRDCGQRWSTANRSTARLWSASSLCWSPGNCGN